MDILAQLERIGLTRGESTVYSTLLETRGGTTGKIVKHAGISSGKIYEILEKLIQKGLVSQVMEGKIRHFYPAPPKRLISYLEEEKAKITLHEQQIRDLLPELNRIITTDASPMETVMYKGYKGIRNAAYEALESMNSSDEILAMGLTSQKSKEFNILWKQLNEERVRRKIRTRMLFSGKKGQLQDHFMCLPFTDVRSVRGITPAAVDVFGIRTLIISYEEPSCILITSAGIAKSFRQFFETMWISAGP